MTRRITISTDVEIDLDEVLDEVTTRDLREECQKRGILLIQPGIDQHEDIRDTYDRIRHAAEARDMIEIDVLLLRLNALVGMPRLTIPRARHKPEHLHG